MMSPTAFFFTASGLMMVSVRCSVFISQVLGVRSQENLPGSRDEKLTAACRLLLYSYSEHGRERFADVGRRFRYLEAGFFHGRNLFGRGALAAGDDRTGMAHAASGRRCLSRDEADDRLLHMRPDELRGGFLRVAPDLADHDYSFGLRIAIEKIERIDKIRADNGISANANRRRLPDSALGQLMHRFVGQRPGARHDADIALFVDRRRHD